MQVVEAMRKKACQGVKPFQNKQGQARYNFWQTNPGRHFPNGKILGRWDYFRPPDDADDSVMIYQMQKRNSIEALWLKKHIDAYANGSQKWIQNTLPPYRKLRAFATFFSKDMPLGFDACVICNILYFNLKYGFEPTIQDQESIFYLVEMLERKHHINCPQKVSPYYPHTSVICYHLARLLSAFALPELGVYRESLLQLLESYGVGVKTLQMGYPEQKLLENAWMWLSGKPVPETWWTKSTFAKADTVFYFFVLPLTLEYEGWIPQFLAHKRLSHIRFRCEALQIALQVENEVLRQMTTDISQKAE